MNVQPSNLPATEIVPSTCWECSALCGSLLTIEDGKVTKIAPNPEHSGSRGAFCVKGIRALHEWTYQEQRLRTPLRRVGERGSGRFAPVSWNDALDEMADGLVAVREKYGPLAIAGAVSGAFFSRGLVMAQLTRAIGTPNWLINQDLCHGCRGVTAARFGVRDADWIKVEAVGGSGSCQLKAKVTGDTLPDVLTTGVGWWRPDAPAPHFGARDVNINAALSYRTRWDLASGSADTRGIPCRIVQT